MAVTKAQKAEVLQELVDKFGRSKSVVFADYRGLDVKSLSELRGELRKEDAEFKVSKKTLMRIAAKENKLPDIDSGAMEGPVGAVFSYDDALAAIRIVSQFAKTHENLKVLGGIVEGEAASRELIRRYASIPGRQTLIAQLVGLMKSPVSGFYSVLYGTLAGFVRVVNAYKESRPAETVPAPPAPEEPKEKPEEEPKEKPEEEAVSSDITTEQQP